MGSALGQLAARIEKTRRHAVGFAQGFVINVGRRAIGADDLHALAHVEIDVRVVVRGQRADAFEFLRADADILLARFVVELRIGGASLGHRARPRYWICEGEPTGFAGKWKGRLGPQKV